MKWVKCSDALPPPHYNWMLVSEQRFGTGEPWPFTIARYTTKGWDFFDTIHEDLYSPTFMDGGSVLEKSKITHWMELKRPPPEG